jgi:hypothetical protein
MVAIGRSASCLVVLAMLLGVVPTLGLAAERWTSETTSSGTTVTNGTQSFEAPDAKTGRQWAKQMNKAEKNETSGNDGDAVEVPPSGASYEGE